MLINALLARTFLRALKEFLLYFSLIESNSILFNCFNCLRTVAGHQTIPYLKELSVDKGVPAIYTTDNGARFQSKEFADFAEQWGFIHRQITPSVIKAAKMTNTNKQAHFNTSYGRTEKRSTPQLKWCQTTSSTDTATTLKSQQSNQARKPSDLSTAWPERTTSWPKPS